ncbi:hypothetical protein FSP39_009580 [Pinctada imbricata]|uniref:UBC core domain-containing protein n=1 Tax=Pinctada imbricata TaxID=66713 RepID=A0AA88XIG2_PINIB|nr:hypothetical protein FSP39_009580 [Pinctada imbricata]
MEFDDIKKECDKWSEESGVQLTSSDAADKRVHFLIPDNEKAFYLNAQSPDLMIWSDDEEVLSQLSPMQDFTSSSKKKSIVEILNETKRILCDDDEDDNGDYDGDDMDDYYTKDEDLDTPVPYTKLEQSQDEEEEDDDDYVIGGASPAAVQRLFKDWKNFKKDCEKFGLGGGPREKNILVWDIILKDIPDSRLSKDLEQYAKKYQTDPYIKMEMTFPTDYPMAPPFVRVVKPRFKFLTGHVTIGGSICMEMLTKSGWVPSNDIENILVQIRCEILSDPNAGLDLGNANREYTEHEAKDAFRRMVQRYNWDK